MSNEDTSSPQEEVIVGEVFEPSETASSTNTFTPYYRPFSFGEAISRGFRGYIKFDGRAARSEYWWWYLFVNLTVVGALILDILFFFVSGWPIPLLFFSVSLALILPSLTVSVRRIHDRNMTGWFILIGLIPFGSFVLLVFYMLEGTKGSNDFGANPLENNNVLRAEK